MAELAGLGLGAFDWGVVFGLDGVVEADGDAALEAGDVVVGFGIEEEEGGRLLGEVVECGGIGLEAEVVDGGYLCFGIGLLEEGAVAEEDAGVGDFSGTAGDLGSVAEVEDEGFAREQVKGSNVGPRAAGAEEERVVLGGLEQVGALDEDGRIWRLADGERFGFDFEDRAADAGAGLLEECDAGGVRSGICCAVFWPRAGGDGG